MEWVTVFKDYVPLFQTIIWVLFIVFGFSIFHKQLKEILGGVHQRITGVAGGGTFKASVGFASIEFSEAVRNLPTTDQATSVKGNALVSQWIEKRKQICENNRCIFLAHVFTPAKTSDQQFNFFIFPRDAQRAVPRGESGSGESFRACDFCEEEAVPRNDKQA